MIPEEIQLLETLEQSCELRSDAEIEAYIEAARRLPQSSDLEVLRRMLHCLRDVDAREVQYELVEACERFPVDLYSRGLILSAKVLADTCPEWFELLARSALNSEEYVSQLVKLAPPVSDRETWAQFLAALKSIVGDHVKYVPVLSRLEAAPR